jgi:ABC-type transport system substrate-binding protein
MIHWSQTEHQCRRLSNPLLLSLTRTQTSRQRLLTLLERLAFLPITLPGIFNPFNYQNAEVDDLLARATAMPDGDERAQLVAEARTIMFDTDMMWVPIVNYAAPVWLNQRISGTPLGMPTYLYYPWAAALSAT